MQSVVIITSNAIAQSGNHSCAHSFNLALTQSLIRHKLSISFSRNFYKKCNLTTGDDTLCRVGKVYYFLFLLSG